VRGFRPAEREELEAELSCTLVLLKSQPPERIKNWRAYLAKALHNSARTWVRRNRPRANVIPIVASAEDSVTSAVTEDVLPGHYSDADLRIAFAQLWSELGHDLRRMWTVLSEENGNQSATARRIGKHRNTVRHDVRQIQQALARHGLKAGAEAISHNTVTPPHHPRRDFQGLEERRFEAVKLVRGGGNQSQVAREIKVARQTVNRWLKRYREAGAVGLRRVGRAGRRPRLTLDNQARLARLLKQAPRTFGYAAGAWSCAMVSDLIKNRFGVVYHPGHVWKLLRTLRRFGTYQS
jgi:transposase/DNA-directed RNA polymerase specialized sigma24 family protein